jgi:hypothetical protein
MSNYLVQSLDRRDFIRKACLAGTALYLGMGENYDEKKVSLIYSI